MNDDEIMDICGVSIALAIDVRETLFCDLADKILVERELEFSGQRDFVRVD